MTKTENKIASTTKRLVKSLSSTYEQLLPEGGDKLFFEEMTKLDAGMGKRLARRPITNMEIETVVKKAGKQFRDMCLRAKQREKQARATVAKSGA
jgi:hypothetical protein